MALGFGMAGAEGIHIVGNAANHLPVLGHLLGGGINAVDSAHVVPLPIIDHIGLGTLVVGGIAYATVAKRIQQRARDKVQEHDLG
jgi:hypothetical protein